MTPEGGGAVMVVTNTSEGPEKIVSYQIVVAVG